MSRSFYYYLFSVVFSLTGLVILYDASPQVAMAVFILEWGQNCKIKADALNILENMKNKLKSLKKEAA